MTETKKQGGNLADYASSKHITNRYKYILSRLKNKEGNLLVIGSGDGSFEKELRCKLGNQLEITSIELNECFRETLLQFSDAVLIDNFLTLELSKKFDFIVSIDVIEHILNTDMFLTKAKELMHTNSVFYLQTPNLASWHARISLLLGYLPEVMEVSMKKPYFGKCCFFRHDGDAIHHCRPFTYRALDEMVKYYGFNVASSVGIDYRIPNFFRPFPNFAGTFCLELTI